MVFSSPSRLPVSWLPCKSQSAKPTDRSIVLGCATNFPGSAVSDKLELGLSLSMSTENGVICHESLVDRTDIRTVRSIGGNCCGRRSSVRVSRHGAVAAHGSFGGKAARRFVCDVG